MRIIHSIEYACFDALDDAGIKMGKLEYMQGGDNELYAMRTEINSSYEGRGLAMKLVDALVEYALMSDTKIIPLCPYVFFAFEEDPKKYKHVMKA